MTAKKGATPVKKPQERKDWQFDPVASMSHERGIICDTTLSLRLPSELKAKLKELPNWQDQVRQVLAQLAGY